MKILLSAITIFLATFSQGQFVYINSYGGLQNEVGSDIIETENGGLFALGSTGSNSENNNSQVYLVKLDSNLVFQWSKVYGSGNVESGKSIVKTADNNYLILANSAVENDYEIKLYKINNNGDLLWTQSYGGNNWDFGSKIIAVENNNFLIVGSTYSIGAGQKDAYLIKINDLGEVLWQNSYGEENDDEFKDLAIDNDGNYIAVGKSNSFNNEGYFESYFAKLSVLGDTIWTNTYSFNLTDAEANGVAISPINIMIVGSTYTDNKAWQMFNLLIDSDGTISNYGEAGNAPNDFFNNIIYHDDVYFIAGETHSYGGGAGDAFFFKVNIYGGYLGSTTYGGTNNDNSLELIMSQENHPILIGKTSQSSESSNENLMVIEITDIDDYDQDDFKIYNSFVDYTIAIEEYEESEIILYPNPIKDDFIIESKNFQTIDIINSLGDIIYSKKLTSNIETISTNNFSSGLYTIIFRSSEDNSITRIKKIIIQ